MTVHHSLFRRAKDQAADTAFAVFYAEKNAGGQDDYDAPFVAIAARTWDGLESWKFQQSRFLEKYKCPVQKIKNYLDYTYVRLTELEKQDPGKFFRYSSDSEWVCFNTGLQNPHQSDLLATFQKSKSSSTKPGAPWVFRGCFAPNEDGYKKYFPQELPDIAWYSKHSQDFIFDTSYQLEDHTFDHLFDRAKERAGLPNAPDEGIRNYLSGTIKNLVPKIKRNYKVAIPVWYVKQEKMQLLLPFPSAAHKNEFAAFLVDRDDSGKIYRLKTIFDLDQAYFSARLITRPDQEWLNP